MTDKTVAFVYGMFVVGFGRFKCPTSVMVGVNAHRWAINNGITLSG